MATRSTKPAAPARRTPARRSPAPDFEPVFAGLKRVLAPYARRMAVKHDGPGIYYLESASTKRYGVPVFFGAVRTGKRYVSYHLMPLYVFPELVRSLSPALKRRMQGKSCFNFRTVDRALFGELRVLTRQGYEKFERGGVFEK